MSVTLAILGFVVLGACGLTGALLALVMFSGAPHAFGPSPVVGSVLTVISVAMLWGAWVLLRRVIRSVRSSAGIRTDVQ